MKRLAFHIQRVAQRLRALTQELQVGLVVLEGVGVHDAGGCRLRLKYRLGGRLTDQIAIVNLREAAARAPARQQGPAVVRFRSRAGWVENEAFGVSAQGGRLPDDQKKLLEKGSVRDRAYARDAGGVRVGLARPLEWALFG